MSIRPARVRAIVVAILVLAFVIPWTYAHIAYSWDWKEKTEGDACTAKYYLTPYDNNHSDFLGGARDLHRGDSITVEGVGTFTLKEAHSDIVWFTPNRGTATFCFDPDPTFTFRDFP